MEEGRQRRSARLSALDKCKQEKAPCGGVPKVEKWAEDGKEAGSGQKLPGKKRGRKRKKLQEVEAVVVNSVDEVVEEVCFFDHSFFFLLTVHFLRWEVGDGIVTTRCVCLMLPWLGHLLSLFFL